MITFEDSIEGKPLKLYRKGFEFKSDIPLKNDGPIEEIKYEMKMPLSEELKYFINNMDSLFDLANIDNALDVTKILISASNSLRGE